MGLMEIIKEWSKDSVIDSYDLGASALRIPILHSKYYQMFIKEKLLLEKMKLDQKQFDYVMFQYYSGQLSKEDLQENDLPVMDIVHLRQDIPK